jgi:hypothetical protein
MSAMVRVGNRVDNPDLKAAGEVFPFLGNCLRPMEPQAIRGSALPAAFEQRILSMERKPNWDGRKADAITSDTCRAALQFERRILAMKPGLPLPYTAATTDGAVSLRWVNGDQDFAIYVYSRDRVATYRRQPNGRYAVVPAQPDEAVNLLLAFNPQQH